jgi:hypothetical protein
MFPVYPQGARCLGDPLPRRSRAVHHEDRGLVGVVVSLADNNDRHVPEVDLSHTLQLGTRRRRGSSARSTASTLEVDLAQTTQKLNALCDAFSNYTGAFEEIYPRLLEAECE